MKLYVFIAQLIGQLQRVEKMRVSSGDHTKVTTIREQIAEVARDFLPRGSGFDSGTTINLDVSTPNRIHMQTAFHHMDENGSYDGWTHHDVFVTADMEYGFHISVRGRDRNNIKEYIESTLADILEIDNDFKFTSGGVLV